MLEVAVPLTFLGHIRFQIFHSVAPMTLILLTIIEQLLELKVKYLARGVKLIFTAGHISLVVAFKGPIVILGLYK